MTRPWALGTRFSAMTAIMIGVGCAHAHVDPPFSAEPRLEAAIEALGDEVARLRLERDSLVTSNDSLRAEIARLRIDLQRIKEIDLRRRQTRP